MAKKEILATDIPEWELGNVMVKSFSFKDTTYIQGLIKEHRLQKLEAKGPDGQDQFKEVVDWKDGTDVGYMNYYMLCAGIHFIRNKDVEGFHIKPGTTTEEKLVLLKDIDGKSGAYLTDQIGTLMIEMSEDKKKS